MPEINHSNSPALTEIADLLAYEAAHDSDATRGEQKQRAASLIRALLPKDPGFAIGDQVEVHGEVLFINSIENGTTVIRLSDVARVCVLTRFVKRTPPQPLAEAVIKLLETAEINQMVIARIVDLIVSAQDDRDKLYEKPALNWIGRTWEALKNVVATLVGGDSR